MRSFAIIFLGNEAEGISHIWSNSGLYHIGDSRKYSINRVARHRGRGRLRVGSRCAESDGTPWILCVAALTKIES